MHFKHYQWLLGHRDEFDLDTQSTADQRVILLDHKSDNVPSTILNHE
jgi:hypothetical protein